MARFLGVDATDSGKYYFISYNDGDQDRVQKYVQLMDESNVPIWYDYGLKFGSQWETSIAEHIQGCEAVVIFASKNIFKKEKSYVHKEYEMAVNYFNKPIYVVMLDNIKKTEVPLQYVSWWIDLNNLHCIHAYNYNNVESCVCEVISAIGFKPKNALEKSKTLLETQEQQTTQFINQTEKLEQEIIQAMRVAINENYVSVSMLQRKLGLGYPKAGKILDAMTERGYVSEFDGVHARKVLMDKESFERTFGESFIKKQSLVTIQEYLQGVSFESDDSEFITEEEIIQAMRIAIKEGNANISMLQRALGIGYPKAGELFFALVKRGYVSPSEGFRRSKVLMDKAVFEQTFGESFDEE